MKRILTLFAILITVVSFAQTQQGSQFQRTMPKPLEYYQGKFSGGVWQSYASTAEANAAIPSSRRYLGLTVCIGTSTNCTEYWYNGGVADGNLVLKFVGDASTLTTGTLPAARIADGSIGIAKINATGTPSSTTYLRGDGSWATPAGGGGGSGTVTSVAIAVPSAFSVSGGPITGSGTITISAPGTSAQYINGAGAAASLSSLPISGPTQTALDLKAATTHNHNANDIASGLLPVARGGTGTATPGIVAGTNVSVTGTWPNQTINTTGGAKDTLFPSVSHTGIDPIGNFYFFGDSYLAGVGVSSTDFTWSSVLCRRVGATQHVFGVAGSTLEKQSPIDYQGAANMLDRRNTIPVRSVNDKAAFIAIGLNDAGCTSPNYNVTNFKNAFDSVMIDFISKNWLPAQLPVLSIYWIGQAGLNAYGAISGNPSTPTKTRLESIVQAQKEMCKKWGNPFIDVYHDELQNDTTLMADGIHANNAGHAFIAYDVQQALGLPNVAASDTATSTDSLAIPAAPIVFSPATALTQFGSDWYATGGGSNYGDHTGLGGTFAGDARIYYTGTSDGGLLGLSTANTEAAYTVAMPVGMIISGSSIFVIENNTFNATPKGAVNSAYLYSIARVGANYYLQYSGNSGVSWTNIYTYSYTSSTNKYILANSATGHLDAPKFQQSGSVSRYLSTTGGSVTGDIDINTNSAGVILRSPNNTKYRLVVDNSGTLTTTVVP
jgi:lysophospholipase L1-like esterase